MIPVPAQTGPIEPLGWVFPTILEGAAFAAEIAGAAVIVGTSVVVVAQLLRGTYRRRAADWRELRSLLGRGLVLGLEFLIGADILRTIVAPTVEDLIILAAIVVIRTILALSVGYELRQLSTEAEQEEQ